MTSALDLAKYIVTKSTIEEHPVSNLQLQKILYFIHKSLLQNGFQAFDDTFQAWQFGPVVPSVYYNFAQYGGLNICKNYNQNFPFELNKFRNEIDKIIEQKRDCNPWELVNETHSPGGAWAQIRSQYGNFASIPNELIQVAG